MLLIWDMAIVIGIYSIVSAIRKIIRIIVILFYEMIMKFTEGLQQFNK